MVVSSASLRYDDGKMLNGIGTRASKSRLTTLRCRDHFSNAFRETERKTRRGLLLLWVKEGEEEGVRGRFSARLSIEGDVSEVGGRSSQRGLELCAGGLMWKKDERECGKAVCGQS